jgi:hypothetical protein
VRGDSSGRDTTRIDRGQQERYLPVGRGGSVAKVDTLSKGDTRIVDLEQARAGTVREEDDEELRFRRPAAPLAVPGEYTVTLNLPDRKLSKPVRVRMDPRIQISDEDLKAQLVASVQVRDLESRVNKTLFRTNDLIRQLTGLQQQLRQSAMADGDGDGRRAADTSTSGSPSGASGASGAGNEGASAASGAEIQRDPRLAQGADAIRKLTQLRDSAMARPIPNLGYRQYPRLRDEVVTLSRMIAGPTSKPTVAQLRRYDELVQEAQRVEGLLNAIVGNEIAKINDAMRASPRIFAGKPIM